MRFTEALPLAGKQQASRFVGSGAERARDILAERYARGEID